MLIRTGGGSYITHYKKVFKILNMVHVTISCPCRLQYFYTQCVYQAKIDVNIHTGRDSETMEQI